MKNEIQFAVKHCQSCYWDNSAKTFSRFYSMHLSSDLFVFIDTKMLMNGYIILEIYLQVIVTSWLLTNWLARRSLYAGV